MSVAPTGGHNILTLFVKTPTGLLTRAAGVSEALLIVMVGAKPEELLAEGRRCGGRGGRWLDPYSWRPQAYEVTELPRERWTLCHSIRRKWATERKGYPVRDVMEAGGWKNEETLWRSYQQPDAETVRQVVLHPTQRIVNR